MINYLLRRKGLGKGSCTGISKFSKTGIEVFRNDVEIPFTDGYVFRWGCTSNIPKKMDAYGDSHPTIVNQAKAIHWVSDKRTSRKIMADAGLAPKTWLYRDQVVHNLVAQPVVVRPSTHAQGKHLDVCHDYVQLAVACGHYDPDGYYISELIQKVAEYRVFVCQGRAVWVASKTPGNPDQVAWNVAQGGKFENVKWGGWPIGVVKASIEAFTLSGLDFGGVDVMVDQEGKSYVLEINSAPSQTSPYRQECVSKSFDYIIENGKEMIPLGNNPKGYRSYIHPAVDPEAII